MSQTVEAFTDMHRSSSTLNSTADDSAVSTELLAMYYSRLFPYKLLCTWLSYDTTYLLPKSANATQSSKSKTLFSKREFSFTIEPSSGEEIYIRYQSFLTENEFSTAVIKRRPTKIDIGAVFTHPPKNHHALQGSDTRKFMTEERELVFDVDLTDYDCVRNCGCAGATICSKCWKMMTMAMKVVDVTLRDDFGFKHIAWIYSGRRGVHAWVCDESARLLTNEGRSAIAAYLEVQLGSDNNKDVSLSHPLHPMLARAYLVLEPMFIQYILPASGHGILSTPDQWNSLLATIPSCANVVAQELSKKWANDQHSSPEEKWEEVKRYLAIFAGKSHDNQVAKKMAKKISNTEKIRIEQWPVEIVFKYTYPRLDINVSKMQNHLLKSPFCVHPKTGRVCVPIDTQEIDEFDPFEVPTLKLLIGELDQIMKNSDSNDVADTTRKKDCEYEWQKTSLNKYFESFNKGFLVPMLRTLRRNERLDRDEKAGIEADF